MIKVKFYTEKDLTHKVVIDGHSGYADVGKDIVCASVSSMVITTVNMILRLEKEAISYTTKDGFIEIVIHKHTDVIDTIIENLRSLLQELAGEYPKNIKIIK